MSIDIGRIYDFSLCRTPPPVIEHGDDLERCQRLGCPVDVYTHDGAADNTWARNLIRDSGGLRYVPAGEGLT